MKWKRRKRQPRSYYESKRYWIGRPFTGTDPDNIRTYAEILRFFAENPRPATLKDLEYAVRDHQTDNQTQPEPWQFIAYLYDCWWLVDADTYGDIFVDLANSDA